VGEGETTGIGLYPLKKGFKTAINPSLDNRGVIAVLDRFRQTGVGRGAESPIKRVKRKDIYKIPNHKHI
jgi:hypothetical protein